MMVIEMVGGALLAMSALAFLLLAAFGSGKSLRAWRRRERNHRIALARLEAAPVDRGKPAGAAASPAPVEAPVLKEAA